MRLFFVFLLILNFLFAGWQYLQPSKSEELIEPFPAELNRLQLLAELKEKKQIEDIESPELVVDTPEIVDISTEFIGDVCYTLGPFKDEEILQQVKGALSEQDLDVVIRKREESERHRYWVYLPAFESRAQSVEMSKKLAQKNIKDYYIVRSGDMYKSISLGHFKDKAYADRRVSNLKKRGFDAEIEVIYRNFNIFWLDYRLASNEDVSDEHVREFLVEGVVRLDRDCN